MVLGSGQERLPQPGPTAITRAHRDGLLTTPPGRLSWA